MTVRKSVQVTERHQLQEIAAKEKRNKKSAYDAKLKTNPQELINSI